MFSGLSLGWSIDGLWLSGTRCPTRRALSQLASHARQVQMQPEQILEGSRRGTHHTVTSAQSAHCPSLQPPVVTSAP